MLYLPSSCVSPEVSEGALEPVVDLVQRQLLVRRFDDGLEFSQSTGSLEEAIFILNKKIYIISFR